MGILVVGSINTDFVVLADRLPLPGESVVGHDFFQAFGGKGANQAVGISRLGISPVTFVGAVGDDEIGSSGLASLRNELVDCEYVRVVPGVRSGVALIMLDSNGENCIAAAPGANAFVDPDYIQSLPDSLFASAKIVVICQEIPLESIKIVLERAHRQGAVTLLNPAPPNPGLRKFDLLRSVDILTPNETEVASILRTENDPAFSLETDLNRVDAVKSMLELGATHIAITMGSKGCFVFDSSVMEKPEDSMLIPASPVNAVDTTAAGDSFNAAVAAGVHQQLSFLEACRWANRVAAVSVTRKGAQPSLPRIDEVPSIENHP